MSTATLLKQIYRMPVHERMLIAERTIHSIRAEKNESLNAAEPDAVQTHYASEQVLSKDWSTETEDEAWKRL
jgi:hypothetical protein